MRGQDDQAETYFRRWLTLEPWQERAYCYLMLLLARTANAAPHWSIPTLPSSTGEGIKGGTFDRNNGD